MLQIICHFFVAMAAAVARCRCTGPTLLLLKRNICFLKSATVLEQYFRWLDVHEHLVLRVSTERCPRMFFAENWHDKNIPSRQVGGPGPPLLFTQVVIVVFMNRYV